MQYTVSRYDAGQILPLHEHQSATICYVVCREFEDRSDSYQFDCGPGSLLYRPAGRPHSDFFRSNRTITLALDLSSDLAEYGPSDVARFPGQKAGRLVRSIYRELSEPDSFSGLALQSLMNSLHSEIALIPEGGEPRPPAWLRKVHSVLYDEKSAIPSLQELADLANVHPMHLTRVFRSFYGCSIGQFLRDIRIERCCKLLESEEIELGEIASKVGFCDQAHFNRAFRVARGCTPGQYRSNARA